MSIGQSLIDEDNLLWDYLSNSLKDIHISVYDTLSEKDREDLFVGNYLTCEKSINKKSFYLKFDNLKYTIDYSIRDTAFVYNNYDIFFIESGALKIGLILSYFTDENNICYGAYFLNRILLIDSKSYERYIIAIESLFESVYIPKKGLLIPPSPDDIEKVEYRINPELKSSNVYSVVKVNEKLEAISRLNFCNDMLISFSEIKQSTPKVETIEIYSCNETELFESISFVQLKRLLQYGTLKETDCSIRIKNIKVTNKPYWVTLSRSYD